MDAIPAKLHPMRGLAQETDRAFFVRRMGKDTMQNELILQNRLREVRAQRRLSQAELAAMVGVSRNTISSIETGQFTPSAKLALLLCLALDKKFEELFYF